MHEPAAPTVFVRGGVAQRIVLAHDGSADARAAEDALLQMPWISSAEVLVVSVSDHQTQADPVIEAAVACMQGHASVRSMRRCWPRPTSRSSTGLATSS